MYNIKQIFAKYSTKLKCTKYFAIFNSIYIFIIFCPNSPLYSFDASFKNKFFYNIIICNNLKYQ